jgi:transcriptional regulator with XRE-family HTH domain
MVLDGPKRCYFMTIGDRLRELRLAAKMSQVALADKADIPLGTLAGLEQGRRLPAWSTLQRLIKAMGATLGDLDGCEMAEEKQRSKPVATYIAPSPRARPTRELKNDETIVIKPAKAKKKGE